MEADAGVATPVAGESVEDAKRRRRESSDRERSYSPERPSQGGTAPAGPTTSDRTSGSSSGTKRRRLSSGDEGSRKRRESADQVDNGHAHESSRERWEPRDGSPRASSGASGDSWEGPDSSSGSNPHRHHGRPGFNREGHRGGRSLLQHPPSPSEGWADHHHHRLRHGSGASPPSRGERPPMSRRHPDTSSWSEAAGRAYHVEARGHLQQQQHAFESRAHSAYDEREYRRPREPYAYHATPPPPPPPYYSRRNEPLQTAGRDVFGRDWPPPGRGSSIYEHHHHHHHQQQHDHYRNSQFGEPGAHQPRFRPRPSYPPSDRSGEDWGRGGHRERGWAREEPRPSRNHRGGLSEADLSTRPLQAYKQWLELQGDSVAPHDAMRQYEEYKSTYMRNLAFGFFTAHKDESWFLDKYHPDKMDKKHQGVMTLAKHNYDTLVAALKEGKLHWNNVEPNLSHPSQTREANEGESRTEDGDSERRPGRDATLVTEEGDYEILLDHLLDAKQLNPTLQREVEPPRDPHSLCIKHIPVQSSREEISALFEQVEGFVELVLSEPKKFHHFHRTGWVVYDNADACQRALQKFNGYRLRDYDLQVELAVSGGDAEARRKRVRVAPPVADEEARLKKDADTAAQLVRVLDEERAIDSSGFFASMPSLDVGTERSRVDRSIGYLRCVHLFCYYCGEQYASEAELRRSCGDVPHRRAKLELAHEVSPEEVSWLAYLDARLEQRLLAPSPLSYTAKERVEREQDTLLDAHVKQEDEKKYRCAVPKCGKLFMAPDFVRKHIRLKHPDLIEEATHKAVKDQYFQNYLNDPRRILPSMPEAMLSARPERGSSVRGVSGGSTDGAGPDTFYTGGGAPGLMGDKPVLLPPPLHRHSSSPHYGGDLRGMGGPAGPGYVAGSLPPFRSRGGGGGGGGGRFGGPHRPGYVDLDAPPDDSSLGDQRAAIDYGDLDAVPEPPPSISRSMSPPAAE